MALTRAFKNSIKYEQRAVPLVVNGDMAVAQRSDSVTGLGDGDEGYVTVDRIRHTLDAGAGRFTSKQTAITDLPGFSEALELDCTTADTSIAADESFHIDYRMEGQDVQHFKKGHSDADYITVGFYAKADAAITYTAGFIDTDNSRQIRQQFTTSTSWTHHVLAFAGDTSTGDKLNDDNAESLRFRITLHGGSDYTSGTLQTTWADTVNANRYVGQVDALDSTDNNWQITGVQLEIGEYTATTIPPFRHIPFALDILRCQRYFQIKADGDSQFFEMGGMYSGSLANGFTIGPCRMRVAPTVSVADGSNYFSFRSDNGDRTSNTLNGAGSQHGARIQNLYVSGLTVTQGYGGFFRTNNASAYVHFSSDL